MKKLNIFLIIVGLLVITACNQETVNEQHKQYLLTKGWEIKESTEVETYTLEIPEEMLLNYEASGITFLREHEGETVTTYSYVLKEKDIEGERLKATIFEVDDEIIGGYGALPSWTPGIFNLDEKERLINEQMIQQ